MESSRNNEVRYRHQKVCNSLFPGGIYSTSSQLDQVSPAVTRFVRKGFKYIHYLMPVLRNDSEREGIFSVIAELL